VLSQEFVGGRYEQRVMLAALQSIEADVPGALEEAQQSRFGFARTGIVRVDNQRFCCIIGAPLVVERVNPLLLLSSRIAGATFLIN
jgi:hypothetical protein